MPERSLEVAFMQRFPLTARLRLEKAVSKAQLSAAAAEVRDAESKVAADVRRVSVKLLALRAQQELRQQQLANSREQTEFVTKRVTTGEGSAVDAIQVDLETQQLEVEFLQLESARATLTAELRPLLGISANRPIEIAGTLPAPGTIPRTGATGETRPDLQAAHLHALAARQNVGLAKVR